MGIGYLDAGMGWVRCDFVCKSVYEVRRGLDEGVGSVFDG